MQLPVFLTTLFLFFAGLVAANVEKTIFTAPGPTRTIFTPPHNATVFKLSDAAPRLRTTLKTSFIDPGAEYWLELSPIQTGSRYEVRVCWPATSPTAFSIHPVGLPFDSIGNNRVWPASKGETELVRQYVRMLALTDYVSDDKKRMEKPDDVEVELILDRYLFGVAPESLKKIGVWVVVVAGFSWWFGGKIAEILKGVAKIGKKEKKNGKVAESKKRK